MTALDTPEHITEVIQAVGSPCWAITLAGANAATTIAMHTTILFANFTDSSPP